MAVISGTALCCGRNETRRARALGARAATVGSILRLSEGSLAPVACLEQNPVECRRMAECRTLPMWRKLNTMINDYFDGITLADLVNTSQPGNDYVI